MGRSVFLSHDADYTHAKFYDNVTFADAIFNSKLFLRNTIIDGRCEFRGASFGDYIDLIGTDFRGSVFMNPKKLYEEKAEPKNLIVEGGMIYADEMIEDITDNTMNVLLDKKVVKKVETNKNYVQFNNIKDAESLEEILNSQSQKHIKKIVQYWKRTQEHNQINIHATKRLCNKMGYE